jgi:hypothetical protein
MESFINACEAGDIKTIESFLDNEDIDIEQGLRIVVKNKKMELIKLLAVKCDVSSVIVESYMNREFGILNYLLNRYAGNINSGLMRACVFKNPNLVYIFITQGSSNFNECLKISCYHDPTISIIRMLAKRATNLNECLLIACNATEKETISTLVEFGATNINECLLEACKKINTTVIDLLISLGATNANECLLYSIEHNLQDATRYIAKYCITHQ